MPLRKVGVVKRGTGHVPMMMNEGVEVDKKTTVMCRSPE